MKALALLDDATRLHDGWSCDDSTECCRFATTKREPVVTAAEWQVIAEAVARSGRRLPAVRADGVCPFLDDGAGRCTIYAARPLGCRTFWCERAVKHGNPRRALRAIVDALEQESGAKGRPLTSYLSARGGRSRRAAARP